VVEVPPQFEPKVQGELIAYDQDFAVVVAQKGDDLDSLAKRYLRSPDKAWWIAEFNDVEQVKPGQLVAIPLRPRNQPGVGPRSMQMVTVLCYHRFGARNDKLVVRPEAFAAQMAWLYQNGYRVISLSELQAFLEGRQALPGKSVAITVDDGYRSTYDVAFPILQKYGYRATVFLYTGFVGASDALSWPQMQEMVRTGLIDIQPHSKTHANLSVKRPGETEAAYRERLRQEIETPKAAIHDKLALDVNDYAFPYGDTSDAVTEQLTRQGIRYGWTVTPGGNSAFAYPFMMRRTMIYGDDDIDHFAAKVVVRGKNGGK
jgi:peptidoglycan/xylan/chitin deacetylase (PgdA/CDA1 family)